MHGLTNLKNYNVPVVVGDYLNTFFINKVIVFTFYLLQSNSVASYPSIPMELPFIESSP